MTEREKNSLLLQWIRLYLGNESLYERVKEQGYRKLAVCGFREYGRLLVDELKKEEADITCIVEKNYQSLQIIDSNLGIPIIGFSAELNCNRTELVLVTPDLELPYVRENLEMAGVLIPVMSMEQLLMIKP